MKPLRILVVTGSRALDVDDRPRRWARRLVAHWMTEVALVVHGGARGPDLYADSLAAYLFLPRVVFPLVAPGRPLTRAGNRARATRDADRYAYDVRDPLTRTAAMVRWAADRAAEGHDVTVLGLRAPWAITRGTAHTLTLAREAELHVVEHEPPEEAWPEMDGLEM